MSLNNILNSKMGRETGLMIVRVMLGCAFIYYGWGKIIAPQKWAWLGSQLPLLANEILNPVWGFFAAFFEFFGGICLVLGLFTRFAALGIACTMAVAVSYHLGQGEGYSTALVYGILAIGQIFKGPDCWSLDRKIFRG